MEQATALDATLLELSKHEGNEKLVEVMMLLSSGANANAIDFPAARELAMPEHQARDEFIAQMQAAQISHQTINELIDQHRKFRLDECPKSEIICRVHELLEGHPVLEREYYNFLRGFGPLHYAAEIGNGMCVRILLEHGATIDEERASRDPLGLFTPLFLASKNGKHRVVEILLAAGAETEVSDGLNPTALACAAMNGYRSIVLALFRAGATPSNILQGLSDTSFAMAMDHVVSSRTNKQINDSVALVARVRKAGDFMSFARNHRRVLGGVVVRCAGRPFPLDAAEHVVEFMCPFGGH